MGWVAGEDALEGVRRCLEWVARGGFFALGRLFEAGVSSDLVLRRVARLAGVEGAEVFRLGRFLGRFLGHFLGRFLGILGGSGGKKCVRGSSSGSLSEGSS